MKKCIESACNSKSSARGYCNKHYQRFIRGVPMGGNPKKTVIERIEEKSSHQKGTGCLIWNGAVSGGYKSKPNTQYGYIKIDGKTQRVHRVMYEIHSGPIPEGMVLCHKCDNPLCINPDHLFLGTQAENVQDMIEKKRQYHPRGEMNNSKLKECEVIRILEAAKQGVSLHILSQKYSVHVVTIRNIVSGKKWAYLSKEKGPHQEPPCQK